MEEKKEELKEEKKETPKKEVKKEMPAIKPGYTIKVYQRINEGKKDRTQIFEGIVLSLRGRTPATKTMTVYKVSQGIGVEKIFPLALPTIEKIVVVKKAKVRQAKLYYLKTYKKRLTEEKVSE